MTPRPGRLFTLALLAAGCDGGLRPFEAPDRVVALVIAPDSILLERGETRQFEAVGRTARGDSQRVTATWSADRGSITPAGQYRSSSADGSWRRPWDLGTAWAGGRGAVDGGDTLWLWGGTYRGSFLSTLAGVAGRPVVVRPFPTERAIIDGAPSDRETLIIDGSWVQFWGLELTTSIPTRTSRRPSGSATRPTSK